MENKQGPELKRFTRLLETIRRDREPEGPEKGKIISEPVKAGYSVSDRAKDNLQG